MTELNYKAISKIVNPIVGYGCDPYLADDEDQPDNGNILIYAGAYEIYSAWNCESGDEGFWFELKPVGGVTENNEHAGYELVAYDHI